MSGHKDVVRASRVDTQGRNNVVRASRAGEQGSNERSRDHQGQNEWSTADEWGRGESTWADEQGRQTSRPTSSSSRTSMSACQRRLFYARAFVIETEG